MVIAISIFIAACLAPQVTEAQTKTSKNTKSGTNTTDISTELQWWNNLPEAWQDRLQAHVHRLHPRTPLIRKLLDTTALDLSATDITDLEPLRQFHHLQVLNLSDTHIRDLHVLAEACPNLTTLWIGGTRITDRNLRYLTTLTHLERLDLSRTEILDLTPLAALPLRTLLLKATKVLTLAPLRCTATLDTLVLHTTYYEELTELTAFTHLTYLDLRNTKIQRGGLSPLTRLTRLRSLFLSENGIGDLEPLRKLTTLERLWIDHTIAADITPLVFLTNLTELRIDHTPAENLRLLANALPRLQKLYCTGTYIPADDKKAFAASHPDCEIQ